MEPAYSIARFVEDVHMAPVHGPISVAWLPNGRTSLVVRVLEEGRGDAYVMGPRTRAKFKRASGVLRTAVVRFKPGWTPSVFGVPAHALTDQLSTLEDLWRAPGADVTGHLVAARSVPEILQHLSRAAASRSTHESASGRLARRAARLFEATETRVEAVAEQLGVTARHLRRAFLDAIGVGPKDFARTARLHRAIRAATHSNDWAAIARDAGYYDQAHLIGDFRALVGLTPTAFLARRS